MSAFQRIGVAGGGAWGTALAKAAVLAGREAVLWTRDPLDAESMRTTGENARHLPGVALPASLHPTADPAALAACDALLLATPAQATRETAVRLAPQLRPGTSVALCAKGIERITGRFLTEVLADVSRETFPMVGVLSGPSFAADVARGLPTAVTLAFADLDLAGSLAAALSGPSFRVYASADPRGAEIGGAGKNVLAIACGAVIGRGLGESARAALMARGFAELLRFAGAEGGDPRTLMGLSGLGDVVLTCGSAQSRNFAFGERLGRGLDPEEAAAGRLVEGALTAPVLVERARRAGVEMPVAEAVAGVLEGRLTLDAAITTLLTRPLRVE